MISGEFDPVVVGELFFPYIRSTPDGRGVIRFIAKEGTRLSGGTGPCFEAVLPYIRGRIIRVSMFGVYGSMPSASASLSIIDPQGGTWSGTVTTSGSKDALGAVTGWIDGRPRLTIDTMGGSSLQAEIVLHVHEAIQTSTSA